MDFGLIVIAGVILYFFIEIYGGIVIAKQLKENKARTGRYSIPWSNMGPIRKGLLIALPCILIGLFIWLYFFSIFAPGPGGVVQRRNCGNWTIIRFDSNC